MHGGGGSEWITVNGWAEDGLNCRGAQWGGPVACQSGTLLPVIVFPSDAIIAFHNKTSSF